MATFTLTVSATVINVTAGTGTLAQLYTDAIAASAGCMTVAGADPYTYNVAGNRSLYLAGCTLNITNPGDILQWNLSGNPGSTYQIFSEWTATLNIAGGAAAGITIDFDTNNATRTSDIHFGGATSFQGLSGFEVVLKHYRNMYIGSRAAGEVHDWDYVKLQDCNLAAGYFFRIDPINYGSYPVNNSSFAHITVENPTAGNYDKGMVYLVGDLASCTFDSWTVDNISAFTPLYTICKFSNSTFQNIATSTSPYMQISGIYGNNGRYTTATAANWFSSLSHQPSLKFDTCTFYLNSTASTTYCIRYVLGSVVEFHGCTFGGASTTANGVHSTLGSRCIYSGTTTFTNVTTARVWTNGTHLHGHRVTITVYDDNGTTLPEAAVTIRQLEDKEYWEFQTNASGQVKDIYGDDIVLIEKEETATATYTQWSDGSSAVKKHRITISKTGFQPWVNDYVMTAAKTISVKLMPVTGPRTLPQQY